MASTYLMFFGCLFVAFGPVTALFFLTVARDPQDVIILIASGFFWLLSLLVSALWWLIVSPLKTQLAFAATFSVLFQEAFRYLYYRLLKKAESGMLALSVSDNTPLRSHRLAYVAGMGFGLVQGIFAYTNVLKFASGPGVVGLNDTKGDEYFFLNSAFLTTCFILLHIFWGVIFHDGLNNSSYWKVFYVLATHMLTSLLTLLNANHGTLVSLLVDYLVMFVTMAIAFHTVVGANFIRNLGALFKLKP